MWRRFCFVLSLALMGLGLAERSASGAPRPPRLEVRIAAGAVDAAALTRTVLEALVPLQVIPNTRQVTTIDARIVAEAMTSDDTSLGWVWLQAADPQHVTLYLTTRAPPKVFVRRFASQAGLDPVALELLGLAIQDSIEAVLSGREIGMQREEFERVFIAPPASTTRSVTQIPPPDAPAAPPPGPRVGVKSSYEAALLDGTTLEHGPGLELALELGWLRFGLSAQLRFPIDLGKDELSATLNSRSGRAFLAVPLRLAPQLAASVGAAAGVDRIRVTPRAESSGATPAEPFTVTDVVARAFGSIGRRWGAFEASTSVGVELGLVPAEYSYLRADQRVVLFTPWRLRPLCSVAVGAVF